MSGDIQEQVGEFKLTDLLKLDPKKFQIEQTEKYSDNILKGHILRIDTYVKEIETGEKVLLHTYEFQLTKNTPKWLTKHKLWDYTDKQLNQLRIAMKNRGEKEPTKETIKNWKQALKLDVLQSNNPNK